MAKKGTKFKKYTEEFKYQILKEYQKGIGSIRLGQKYNIPYQTIDTWVSKYKKDGSFKRKKGSGRPKGSPKSELERLRLENEILKKFQAFLEAEQEKR